MNKPNKENLARLVQTFFDAGDVAKVLADLDAGENILAGNPAPEPDARVLANIKSRVAVEIEKRKRAQVKYFYMKAAAIAAMVMIAALIWFKYSQIDAQPAKTTATAQIDPLTGLDDLELQVAQLPHSDPLGLVMVETNTNDASGIDDVETELSDLTNTFWEG